MDQNRAPTMVMNVAVAAIRRAAVRTSSVSESTRLPLLE